MIICNSVPASALAAILFALGSSSASAQVASVPPPAPNNTPQTCDAYLPAGFVVPPQAGASLMSYRLDKTGVPSDPSLIRTSGSPDLDRAALACMPAQKLAPVSVDGEPAELTLIGGVFWNTAIHDFGDPTPVGQPNRCDKAYPPLALRLGQEGTVIVEFHVVPAGSVTQQRIVQSSGYDALDKATLDCVASRHYFPATQHTLPVEIERTQQITWRLPFRASTGPMVQFTVGQDGSILLEGQRFIDVAALRAKLDEIASRNPRPDLCELPMPGQAFAWRGLLAMSVAGKMLNAAGVTSVRFCTVPFAAMDR
jgi:TonB family protein